MFFVHEERIGQVADIAMMGVEMPLAQRRESFLDRQDLRDQLRPGEGRPAGVRIATEAMPQPKQATVERERLTAEPFRGWRPGEVEGAQQVSGDVGPTQLTLPSDIAQIAGQAVAAENPRERRAEDGLQDIGASGRGNPIEHKGAGHECPEPPFVAVGPMAGLVDIHDRFVSHGRFQFPIRFGDGDTGVFPGVLGTPQTDRDLQGALEQPRHHQPRHSAHHREIRNQRGQVRPELAHGVVGERGDGDHAAGRTLPPVAPVLRDMRGHPREVGHLRSSGPPDGIACMKAAGTASAPVRNMINDVIHPVCGYQPSRVSGVARLPSRLAAALDPATAASLPTGETIRRGRFRRDGRILRPQRELTLQILDLPRLLGDLLRALFQFSTQALVFAPQSLQLVRVTGASFTSPSPWLHWPEGTELRQRVQEA